jgi:hypothetical protein
MWGHFLENHKALVVGFPWRCNEIALANLPRLWHCQNFHTPHFPCLLDWVHIEVVGFENNSSFM